MAWRLLLSSSSSILKPSSHLLSTPNLIPKRNKPQHCYSTNNNTTSSSSNSHVSRSLNHGGRSNVLRIHRPTVVCRAQNKKTGNEVGRGQVLDKEEGTQGARKAQQVALWAAEAAYILWLFLLPYAPGDPVWAISSSTINDLTGLSLNFFFVLPIFNYVGIHVLEAPVLHPMSEGLFNFVIGWTLLFAPLLFTDCRRDRYKGSLDILWGFQMFLTNTFLIPYMAIRLNDTNSNNTPPKPTQLASLMTSGARVVGIIGGAACLLSVFWALFARSDGGFGSITERLDFLAGYLASERLAYAFIWDICLYAVFQPWLIGDNLQNVKTNNEETVRNLRFIPVVGLVAYLVSLDNEKVL